MLFQGAPEPPAGTEGVDFFSCGIPRYSMLFQGTPETLVGTEGVYFYMVFHDIPCYSKEVEGPQKYLVGLGGCPGKSYYLKRASGKYRNQK